MMETNTEQHLGILQAHIATFSKMSPPVEIDMFTVQRQLRDQGTLQALHDFLLLPKSYVIQSVFLNSMRPQLLDIWVVSPDLPVVDSLLVDDLPQVSPVYCMVDNTPHLVRIDVTKRSTIPVTGGIDWMLKAL